MSDKKDEKVYTGTVVGKNLVIGTKKPKSIKVGDKFSTKNKEVYQSLINNKRIK